MIPFSEHNAQLTARLEAEGTDSFGLNEDRIPATNAAQRIVQGVLASMLEARKFSGEGLRDLNWTAVFQTNAWGEVDIDHILRSSTTGVDRHLLWTVLAVYPEFEAEAPWAVIPNNPARFSMLRPDVRFVSPIKAAKRWTRQQWADVKQDMFAPGSPLMTNPLLREYGYLFGGRTAVAGGTATHTLLSVMGLPPGKTLVAVNYLKAPAPVPSMPLREDDPLYGSTMLEWPESMAALLGSVTMRQLGYPIGDGTTLNQLSGEEMTMLINAIG